MPKCITCGAEATFIPYNSTQLEFCDWCCSQLPGGLTDVVRDLKISFTIPPGHGNGSYLFEGTWTKDNWMTYPSLAARRAEMGIADISVNLTFTKNKTNDKYPHKCPKCGSPAYIGLISFDCSKGCK